MTPSSDMTLRRQAGRSAEAGLSLLEVMVVLVIMGIVAAFAAPQVLGYLDRSRVDAARIQVRNLTSILDLYRLDTGRYPTPEQGLGALVERPADARAWNGPYLKSEASLTDPWDAPYVYELSADGRSVLVASYGADGAPGGDGLNADITP